MESWEWLRARRSSQKSLFPSPRSKINQSSRGKIEEKSSTSLQKYAQCRWHIGNAPGVTLDAFTQSNTIDFWSHPTPLTKKNPIQPQKHHRMPWKTRKTQQKHSEKKIHDRIFAGKRVLQISIGFFPQLNYQNRTNSSTESLSTHTTALFSINCTGIPGKWGTFWKNSHLTSHSKFRWKIMAYQCLRPNKHCSSSSSSTRQMCAIVMKTIHGHFHHRVIKFIFYPGFSPKFYSSIITRLSNNHFSVKNACIRRLCKKYWRI